MDEQTQQTPGGGQQPQQPAPQSDVEKHKILAIIGYIIPVLFFVPLLTGAKNSKFAMFHANQHLLILIVWLVGSLLMRVFFVGWLIGLFGLVLLIMGIISASKGEMKPLPLIGSIHLIYKG
ncbi:MAG: Uncharacterized protein CEN90_639 [Parcubacteria group bacterium Licking1014_17]|nr:MAG: Uncharacterized protein CEN90_639 [Parcubacteria group bacterium Licking1014_17]